MARVGSLNRRITFEKAVKTSDGAGGFTETFPVDQMLTTWAEVKPASSSRVEQAAHTYLEDTFDFIIRHRKGFEPAIYQRIKFDNGYYSITSTTEERLDHRFWIIRAKRFKL